MKSAIYNAWVNNGDDDTWVEDYGEMSIGLYSTREKAEQAIENFCKDEDEDGWRRMAVVEEFLDEHDYS